MAADLALSARYRLSYDPERFEATERGSLIDRVTGQEYWAEPVLATIDSQDEARALTSHEVSALGLVIQIEGVGRA
jgi:hypothetical protein